MYVFSYFKTEAEALHLALSEDGFHWKPLNRNKPILKGTVNTKSIRDPFIIKAKDGIFHLFFTDGWNSQYIIHCYSEDLIQWSEQVAIPVMVGVPGTRNCWAPECFYDYEEKLYRIIWSSTVSIDGPEKLRDHRIWSTTTKDFIDYTPSKLYFDPGYNVIDATVIYKSGRYLMAFKDERGENNLGTENKAIRVASSQNAKGHFENISGLITPSLTEGPVIFEKDGNLVMFYDHFFEHYYGASLSEDGIHWTNITEQINFPDGVRHGSIFNIDDSLGKKLDIRSKTI